MCTDCHEPEQRCDEKGEGAVDQEKEQPERQTLRDRGQTNLRLMAPSSPLQDQRLQAEAAYSHWLVPRVGLSQEQFCLVSAQKVFAAYDLTPTGFSLALISQADLALFRVGQRLEGMLNLTRKKYLVKMQVLGLGHKKVLLGFEGGMGGGLPPSFAQTLAEFLRPEAIGATLRLFPFRELTSLFYVGRAGALLRFDFDDSATVGCIMLRVQALIFLWERKKGLCSSGVFKEELRAHQPRRASGLVVWDELKVYFDAVLDREKLEIAKKIILSSTLTEHLKNECLVNWQDHP